MTLAIVLTCSRFSKNTSVTCMDFFMKFKFVVVVSAYPLSVVFIVLKSVVSSVMRMGALVTVCRFLFCHKVSSG